MFKNVLFDLDGTLIDSYEGITKSVNYALEKSGNAPAPDDVLRKFIGPPLLYSFEKFCRMSRREADAAVKFYRERYAVRGKFENTVYDGVPRLLKALRENGVKICLATSKPIVFAKEILKHYGLLDYFDIKMGAEFDGRRSEKLEVIQAVLELLPEDEKASTAMVGDRHYDIEGALQSGICPVGAGYGYSEPGELKKSGAAYIAHSVSELEDFLMK